eukprot:766772-Hanusia_phi.AAC.3
MGKRPRADKRKQKVKSADDAGRQGRNSNGRPGEKKRRVEAPVQEEKRQTEEVLEVDKNEICPKRGCTFVEIQEKRLQSRLLYPNPVCLLCSLVPQSLKDAKIEEDEDEDEDEERSETTQEKAKEARGAEGNRQEESSGKLPDKNVMVLSWLTPINNEV